MQVNALCVVISCFQIKIDKNVSHLYANQDIESVRMANVKSVMTTWYLMTLKENALIIQSVKIQIFSVK